MPSEVYEDHGVRFEYPSDWELEVTDEGEVTTVDVQHPAGIAFLLVRTDESCPDPGEVADAALEAMREEYPDLDAVPVVETSTSTASPGTTSSSSPSTSPTRPASAASARPAERCWSSASGRISARRTYPRSSVACSARWKRRRIESRTCGFDNGQQSKSHFLRVVRSELVRRR